LLLLDSSEVESTAADGVFIGLDWGNSHHQLCILDAAGRMVHQGKFAHDIAGARGLTERLHRHGPVQGIAIERSEGLLVETLQQQGHRLFCVSPKMSARARERYRLAPSKSDAFDAFVLADSLRHEHRHWRPLAAPSSLLAELRALTRDRERLIWNQRDVENQLRAVVLAFHPGVLHLFSSLDRDITLAFLRDYPTPAHAGRVGVARMAAFCARHGYSGRTRPELLVERLRANLLSASAGTTAGKAFTAALFVEQLELLNTQVRAITKRIRERLAEHPDAAIFLSFPGMGEVTAAIMLAEMGEDRARFPDRGRAARRDRHRTGDPIIRSQPHGEVPLRSEQADASRDRLVGLRRRPGERLGPRGLLASPRPRATPQPCSARRRCPLDPHPLALLDRPHHLRLGTASEGPTRQHHRIAQLGQARAHRPPRADLSCPRNCYSSLRF
jgi:hypothetical protein